MDTRTKLAGRSSRTLAWWGGGNTQCVRAVWAGHSSTNDCCLQHTAVHGLWDLVSPGCVAPSLCHCGRFPHRRAFPPSFSLWIEGTWPHEHPFLLLHIQSLSRIHIVPRHNHRWWWCLPGWVGGPSFSLLHLLSLDRASSLQLWPTSPSRAGLQHRDASVLILGFSAWMGSVQPAEMRNLVSYPIPF